MASYKQDLKNRTWCVRYSATEFDNYVESGLNQDDVDDVQQYVEFIRLKRLQKKDN